MGYVENHLTDDETVVHRTTLHPILFVWPAVFGTFGLLFVLPGGAETGSLAVAFLAGALITGLWVWIRYRFSEFAVTDRRVILKTGVIRRNTLETMLTGVESVSVDQGLLGRLFGFGKLLVSGTGGTQESFSMIRAPLEFRRHVQEESASSHGRAAQEHISALQNQAGGSRDERECPYCTEWILLKAKVCKHGGREVEPAV